jgi:hypothetical protein
MSDFDADMDGAEVAEYVDSSGNTVIHTGYDCDDNDEDILPLANEADPTACYEDDDGDGWGDINPSSDLVVAGTDCYDSSWSGGTVYPGAAYNEADPTACMKDYDGDGYGTDYSSSNYAAGTDCDDYDETVYPGAAYNESATDCMMDADGDGYGASVDELSSWDDAIPGMDCDDSDATKVPGLDADADGVESCDDCDDDDSTIGEAEMAYFDSDGDGYGYGDSEQVCDLDSDGDGINDYAYDDGDCNDWDEYTYPGAAYNDSTTECLTDADEDGYGLASGCYDLQLMDTYGDGWNGASVTFYLNGAYDSGWTLNDDYSGSLEVCFGIGNLEIGWVSGSFDSECSFILTDVDGNIVFNSDDVSLDESVDANGDGLIDNPLGSMTVTATTVGTDADDADSTVH